jgi:hypothetical protein
MLDHEKEINLNLKIPPEQPDGSFSMRDLVLTLYNGRKIFFICCFAGLLLGIIAAAGYYATTRSSGAPPIAGDTSITLTLNYPGAEHAIYPNGTGFNVNLFYEIDLWERALRAIGRDDITPADAMGEVSIARQTPRLDEHGHPIEEILNTSFIVTIPAGSAVFADKSAKESFLSAFGEEYKNSINSRYFTDSNAGILCNQQLRTWNDSSREIIWDSFSFEQNFILLNSRYEELARLLDSLFSTDPLYRTLGGRSFNDYANDFREIRDNDIRLWTAKLNENVYIRNIDRFRNEYQFQLDTMRLNREYSLEIVDSYNELLTSFQRNNDSHGTIVWDAVATLTTARSEIDKAADLQRQIRQMEYNVQALQINEQALRANSLEAEAALTAFIEDLERNQEELTGIIFNYYKQLNERYAENSVLATTPFSQVSTAAGVSMTLILMLLVGLTFVGFAIGFCGAFVKKYLPERESDKKNGS